MWLVCCAGYLDLLVGKAGSKSHLLYADGPGRFREPVELPGTNVRALALGDLNADGWLDLVIGDHPSPALLLLNDGHGNLLAPGHLPGSASARCDGRVGNSGDQWCSNQMLAVGDVDADVSCSRAPLRPRALAR